MTHAWETCWVIWQAAAKGSTNMAWSSEMEAGTWAAVAPSTPDTYASQVHVKHPPPPGSPLNVRTALCSDFIYMLCSLGRAQGTQGVSRYAGHTSTIIHSGQAHLQPNR